MKNGVSLSNRFLFNPQRVGLRASRLLASLRAGIFPSSSSISGDTTFFSASRQVSLSLSLSLFLFLSWSLSSKESSVVNGVFEELFVAIGQQDNSSPISIQIISHTLQLPVTSLHLFNDGSSQNLSNVVDSPILIPHSIIHLHG